MLDDSRDLAKVGGPIATPYVTDPQSIDFISYLKFLLKCHWAILLSPNCVSDKGSVVRKTDARIVSRAYLGSRVLDEPGFLENFQSKAPNGEAHCHRLKFTRHFGHSEGPIDIGCPEFSENLPLASNPVEPDTTVFRIPLVDHPDRL